MPRKLVVITLTSFLAPFLLAVTLVFSRQPVIVPAVAARIPTIPAIITAVRAAFLPALHSLGGRDCHAPLRPGRIDVGRGPSRRRNYGRYKHRQSNTGNR